MPRPAAAVAVVSWNNRELLAAALRSLKPDADAGRADVWVVDNNSSDGSPEMVREDFPWVSLIASEDNLGYGPAVNLVAERTDSDWVVPANDDVALTPGALERMLRTGAEHPDAAAIAPRLVRPDGSIQQSVQSFPGIPLALVHNSGAYRLSAGLAERLCIPGHWDPGRRREVPWAMAAWLLVRRSAWDEVGGFDRDQWMYAEDLDLGWRLRRAGWKTVYEPDATVLHADRSASTQAFGDQVELRHMEASYAWMARRRGVTFARLYGVLNWLGAGARLAIYTVLAALRPARFGPARRESRHWVEIHRAGLRPRRDLLSPR